MIRQFILIVVVLLTTQASFAQSAFKLTIKDENTKQPIVGVTVTVNDTGISATTDAQGTVQLTNIPDGEQIITIFSPGYESKELKFTFPRTEQNEIVIFIRVTNEVGEVTITSTRTGREIDDVPTRVEAIDEEILIEAGFRLDHLKDYGTFPLPRVSALYRFTNNLSSRLSLGLGYKAPSIFTEEAETLLFQNVLPIGNSLKAERSRGGTLDLNYRNAIGEKFSYSVNHMFFYTEIKAPLVLLEREDGVFQFVNAAQPVRSRGFETNMRLSYDIAKLFAGYTFTNAKANYLSGNQTLPLAPKSRINSALLFEREASFKTGIEAYYTSSQFLTNRFQTRPYWVLGIFGEKMFGKYSLFINAENITDTRQGRFSQVVLPPHQTPAFSEIYAPTEGRVINGGIQIRL